MIIAMDHINFDLTLMNAAQTAELLAFHDRQYWELNEPLISDVRYDEIVEHLRRLDPQNALLSRIHTPQVESGGKVRHLRPMLSLDKAYSLAEVLEWAHKYARTPEEIVLVEPKYDGISANFDGKILSTRGDGKTGVPPPTTLPTTLPITPRTTNPRTSPLIPSLLRTNGQRSTTASLSQGLLNSAREQLKHPPKKDTTS